MTPPDVWANGLAALREEGRGQWFVGSVVQELLDERLADVFPGCRLFRMDSELQGTKDGRLAIQRYFVLRPDDERPYQLEKDDDLIALAKAEDVRLVDAVAAERFVGLALRAEGRLIRGDRGWTLTADAGSVVLLADSESRLVGVARS